MASGGKPESGQTPVAAAALYAGVALLIVSAMPHSCSLDQLSALTNPVGGAGGQDIEQVNGAATNADCDSQEAGNHEAGNHEAKDASQPAKRRSTQACPDPKAPDHQSRTMAHPTSLGW